MVWKHFGSVSERRRSSECLGDTVHGGAWHAKNLPFRENVAFELNGLVSSLMSASCFACMWTRRKEKCSLHWGFVYAFVDRHSVTGGFMHANVKIKSGNATVNTIWQAIINRPNYGEVNNDNQDDWSHWSDVTAATCINKGQRSAGLRLNCNYSENATHSSKLWAN